MQIQGDDLIFEDFRASDFGLTLGVSFSGPIDGEDDTALVPQVTDVFVGEKPNALYLSQKYESHLELIATLSHDPCTGENMAFHQQELRHIMRALNIGKPGYRWLKVVPLSTDVDDDDYYYLAKITNVSYYTMGEEIVGILLTFQCDGGYAYSREKSITINAAANVPFVIYNHSDDFNNYILPTTHIAIGDAEESDFTFTIINQTDNNWEVSIENCNHNETITMQSDREILTSTRARSYILSDLKDLHFIRLVPDKNVFVTNMAATIEFVFREPRKVGYIP